MTVEGIKDEVLKYFIYDLLIPQRERYGLTDDMIYNIEVNKDGKRYKIQVEVIKEELT